MIRVLVTGANGLLGQKLTRLLDGDPDMDLIATARHPLKVLLRRGQYFPLDVTDAAAVGNMLRRSKPDFVIHTAAMTQVDQCEVERDKCWLTNVTAVANIVKACEETKSHLVHVSSDFVFDGSFGPLDETAKPNPISVYGESKLAGEKLVEQSSSPWVVIRTVLVFGVTKNMSRPNIVLWVKKSLEEGKKIQVVNDQWRTPTLAEDLATGCLLAIKKKAQGIYHVSGGEMLTPYDIAIRTAHFFNLDASLIEPTDSTKFRQPARRPPRTGFIIEKAKRELGFLPHSFDEGLAIVGEQVVSNK